jgi:DNA (cytosine-5)-methyltransferase 1
MEVAVSELLTILQAANYLQLSDKTVRRLIKARQLEASKVGDRVWRIKLSDIENYLKTHTNGKEGAE